MNTQLFELTKSAAASVYGKSAAPPLPARQRGASVQSGLWSDSSTWYEGEIPTPTDKVVISGGHTVTIDVPQPDVAGMHIQTGAALIWNPNMSITLRSSKNIINNGVMTIKPANRTIFHTIHLVNFTTQNFVGGGMNPIDSDVGYWTIDNGINDILGFKKRAWARLTATEANGAIGTSSVEVEGDLSTWSVGDEIVICPMDKPTTGRTPSVYDADMNTTGDTFTPQFEKKVIKSIVGNQVFFTGALVYNHKKVVMQYQAAPFAPVSTKTWTAEVLNLTRNVVIKGFKELDGTGKLVRTHRTHTFIRSKFPQSIKYARFFDSGVKKQVANFTAAQPTYGIVLGRYALHFHHCLDNSTGSIVEGVVIDNCQNRAFVPHVSNGITFKDCVAYNTQGHQFWWDSSEITHLTSYLGCVGALHGHNSGGMGFNLGMGDRNVCNDCVAIYAHTMAGHDNSLAGFSWDNSEGVWTFERNLGKCNNTALWVWQNTNNNHTVVDYDSYNNHRAVKHGAYSNVYQYIGGYHYNSQWQMQATSNNEWGATVERQRMDGAGLLDCAIYWADAPIESNVTNKVVECGFMNCTYSGFALVGAKEDGQDNKRLKKVDVINCWQQNCREVADIMVRYYNDDPTQPRVPYHGSWIRVQPPTGQAYEVGMSAGEYFQDSKGRWYYKGKDIVRTNIARFAPDKYGNGTGLLGSYYHDIDLNPSKKLFDRIDSIISFKEWTQDTFPFGIDHSLYNKGAEARKRASIEWNGYLKPMYSEAVTLFFNSSWQHRIYINDALVIDRWNGTGADKYTMFMDKNSFYKVKIQARTTNAPQGMTFNWGSPSITAGTRTIGYDGLMIVQMSQAYHPNHPDVLAWLR